MERRGGRVECFTMEGKTNVLKINYLLWWKIIIRTSAVINEKWAEVKQNYGLCDSWLTRPCWQCLTSSSAHCILQMKSSASQEDNNFLVISAGPNTAEKHSSKIPCQGVESNPVQAWNPACNFWSWSLSVSEWSTVVLVGTCYLLFLIQIFGHFILSKCTCSNTATSVSCETTKLLDAWLFTGGTPSYLPPHERPPNGLCLYLGWETQFEWHHWNHHQLKSSCQLVSVVWVARMMSALFILGWDQVSHLAGRGMTFSHSSEWLGTFVHIFLVPCLIEVS